VACACSEIQRHNNRRSEAAAARRRRSSTCQTGGRFRFGDEHSGNERREQVVK
jgi:hypothetical protein